MTTRTFSRLFLPLALLAGYLIVDGNEPGLPQLGNAAAPSSSAMLAAPMMLTDDPAIAQNIPSFSPFGLSDTTASSNDWPARRYR